MDKLGVVLSESVGGQGVVTEEERLAQEQQRLGLNTGRSADCVTMA
jgi:hypothetical protein